MWKSIQENIDAFWRGTIGGCFTGGTILAIKPDILISWMLSLLTVAVSALIGGLFAALAADLYKHHIKNRFFKDKANEKSDKEKAA